MSRQVYWLDLFTGVTWNEFVESGSSVSGFRESRWTTMQKINIGDFLICYLTGVSRFIGILEITSRPFKDDSPIWKDEYFPCRVKVKPVVVLTPETAIPVMEFRGELSMFKDLKSPHAWTGSFRSSPSKWKSPDGETILKKILIAKENPIIREVNERKLNYRPKGFKSKLGMVSIPVEETESVPENKKEYTEHTEIQYLFLKLGSEMGFDVWVARNDRGKEYKGNDFSKIERIRTELPHQFDDITNKTIELIDVLWLKGTMIIAAFEVESTTSIYSGLLRMSDLIAMQPNLKIPLYLVSTEERRSKVMNEINRPTFSRLSPRLSEICRYISFTELREKFKKIESIIKFIKPEFLEEISESCELEEI